MEKYNSARTDFEQKMLDSALVRTWHRDLGDPHSPQPGIYGRWKSRTSETVDYQEA